MADPSRSIGDCDTPEGRELAAKEAELEELRARLVREETELAAVVADVVDFESQYLATVGRRLVHLDQLRAAIAAHRHRCNDPREEEDLQTAVRAADRSAAAFAEDPPQEHDQTAFPQSSGPSVDDPEQRRRVLKDQYRDLARRSHPDLAVTEAERARRTDLMARVNDAYQRGDHDEMTRLGEEINSEPLEVLGDDVAHNLVRTIRLIAQVNRRLGELAEERRDLHESSSFALWTSAEQARLEGRDLLKELVDRTQADISVAEKELADLSESHS